MSERSRPRGEPESATTGGDVPVDEDDGPVDVEPPGDEPADASTAGTAAAPADVAPVLTERPGDRGEWTVDSPTEGESR